ncbi:MAG: hypothetical protein JSV44_04600, partial [Candidatus Zixiibacteriota bacterium]
MRKAVVEFLIMTLALAGAAAVALADGAPSTILYQGRLTQDNGDPITVATDLTFRIYPTDIAVSPLYTQVANVTPDDNGVFTIELGPLNITSHLQGTVRWLGITVGADAEMAPRQPLTSVPYAISSEHAEFVPDGSITSAKIFNGTITNTDISGSAAISTTKISGTAVNLSSAQTITGSKTFTGTNYFGDSTLRINASGITIGSTTSPSSSYLLRLGRGYNTTNSRYGMYLSMTNSNTGTMQGLYSIVNHTTTSGGGVAYGVYTSSYTDGGDRYGVRAATQAHTASIAVGTSYGLWTRAWDGSTAYGVYAAVGFAATEWAGWFAGNLHSTGTNTFGKSAFKIDHP